MPNRVIKESIKRSPQIDALTWFEEVLFYRLMVTADDYGCADGRPILLKNELFPTKENITKKSIEDAIRKLTSVGLLLKYEVNGMPYLLFPTWEKHQRIRNKHRKYPAPPEDIHLTADCRQMTADCLSESNPNPNPNPNPESNDSAHARGGVAKFAPPTVQEVAEYAKTRTVQIDPQEFVDFYASKGWMVGKTKMVDWKSSVRTWERRKAGEQSQKQMHSTNDSRMEEYLKW